MSLSERMIVILIINSAVDMIKEQLFCSIFKQCTASVTLVARLISSGEFNQIRYRVVRLFKHYLRLAPEPSTSIYTNEPTDYRYKNTTLDKIQSQNRLAVSIHAYYPSIAINELAPLINERLCPDVDVFISVPSDTAPSILDSLRNAYNCPVNIIPIFNKGRDILPFLTVLPLLIKQKYDWVCKVHTKKSLHTIHGISWRRDLYRTLLSDRSIHTVKTMSQDFGLAYPWFSKCSIKNFTDGNYDKLNELAITNSCHQELSRASFIAGSMFWFRPQALSTLANVHITQYESMFEPEKGQIDGTYAHAMERLFLHIVHQSGYQSKKLT